MASPPRSNLCVVLRASVPRLGYILSCPVPQFHHISLPLCVCPFDPEMALSVQVKCHVNSLAGPDAFVGLWGRVEVFGAALGDTLPLRRVGGVGLLSCSAGAGIGRAQRILGVAYAPIPLRVESPPSRSLFQGPVMSP